MDYLVILMAAVALATINISAEPLNIPRHTRKVGSLLSMTNLEAATFEEYPMLNRKKRFAAEKCIVDCGEVLDRPCYIGKGLTCSCCTSDGCGTTETVVFSEGITKCPNSPEERYDAPHKCVDDNGCVWGGDLEF